MATIDVQQMAVRRIDLRRFALSKTFPPKPWGRSGEPEAQPLMASDQVFLLVRRQGFEPRTR